jgi:hypothetical protein
MIREVFAKSASRYACRNIVMGDVGLLLSGAVLFLNSMMLMGKADGKSVAILNLLVGALQVIVPFYLIVVSDQQHWTIYTNASIFLFGLTYLYLGITILWNLEDNGLGWFSIWVSIIALVYTVIAYIHFKDPVNALTWLLWAFLWFLFYLANTRKMNIQPFIGKVAFVQSWVTLTIPALASLTGAAVEPVYPTVWLYVLLASIVAFVVFFIQAKGKRYRRTDTVHN